MEKTIGERIKDATASVSDYVQQGLHSALELYIDTIMPRPTWADTVTSITDVANCLTEDFKANVVRSFALSLFSKLGVADQTTLAAEMAEYLVKAHPAWFTLYYAKQAADAEKGTRQESSIKKEAADVSADSPSE